jgi:hypothetical protein
VIYLSSVVVEIQPELQPGRLPQVRQEYWRNKRLGEFSIREWVRQDRQRCAVVIRLGLVETRYVLEHFQSDPIYGQISASQPTLIAPHEVAAFIGELRTSHLEQFNLVSLPRPGVREWRELGRC